MSGNSQRSSVEGLPKQFVASLKVLYDILDEDRSGFVKLSDIETRWHGEGVHGLPVGVLEALRKVTPVSGFLTFERFVMGLKLALFKSKHNVKHSSDKVDRTTPTREGQNQNAFSGPSTVRPVNSRSDIQLHQIPAAQQQQKHTTGASDRTYGTIITATVRPNNAINTVNNGPSDHMGRQNKASQMVDNTNANSKYSIGSSTSNANFGIGSGNVKSHPGQAHSAVPPPRPARAHHLVRPQGGGPLRPYNSRTSATSPETVQQGPPQVPPRDYGKSVKSTIINELKQWQQEQIRSQGEQPPHPRITSVSSDSRLLDQKPNTNTDIYVNVQHLHGPAKSAEPPKDARPMSKVQARRREPRRHTVANGVDYNMVKRMKQLEEERDLLLQGLESVDCARDWYHKRITAMEAKQRNVGREAHNDYSVEANQERVNFLKAKIVESSQQMKSLIESSERGFPLHMNLAVQSTHGYSEEAITINMLKEQNKLLTKEVGQKGEKITQLEREKASLIREMFETRALAKNKSGYDDTTFM